MHKFSKLCTTLLAMLLLSSHSVATVRYARATSQGTGTGDSWANASSDIQALINASSAGDEIWVAAGTYIPTRLSNDPNTTASNNRANSFVLKSGVKIYGGFSGTETNLADRNWTINTTTLSGDINTIGINSDNVNNVIVSAGCNSSTELNGFTITAGYIDNGWEQRTINGLTINVYNGAGISCTNSDTRFKNLSITNCRANRGAGIHTQGGAPLLENITVSHCTSSDRGGGIYINNSNISIANLTLSFNSSGAYGGGIGFENSSASISNIVASSNTSQNKGGGIYLSGTSPTITNATIIGNTVNSDWDNGGGIFMDANSNPTIYNALICKNSTGGSGGGVAVDNSSPTIVNATIADNRVRMSYGNGGGIFGNVTLKNSIVWGNYIASSIGNISNVSQIYNCLIQGGTISSGTIISNSNPRFNNSASDDYTLKGYSPAVNAGNNSYNSTTTDLAGNSRIFNNGTIDLGAYEYQSTDTSLPPRTRIVYVKSGATGNGTSWNNAYGQLSDAITECDNSFDIAEIWVTTGTYKPQNYAGNGNTDYTKAFVLPTDVKIYGGFAGSETLCTQRDSTSGKSILSAVLNNGTKVQHVVIASGNVGTACLNGFSITGAYCNNSSFTVNSNNIDGNYGAGIYCTLSSPTFANLSIYSNSSTSGGGGIYCLTSSPTIRNCKIYSNTTSNGPGGGIACYSSSTPVINKTNIYKNVSSTSGGGIYCDASSPTITNCQIDSCTASNGGGGAMRISNSSSPSVINTKIYSNSAVYSGGGLYIDNSTPVLTNLLIYKNTASQHGGAIYVGSGTTTITNSTIAYNTVPVHYGSGGLEGSIEARNCIVWGNTSNGFSSNYYSSATTFAYSLVEAATLSGTSIIGNSNPRFTDTATDDYRLNGYSPGINAGNNAYNSTTTDLAGNPRIYDNAIIDLGPYEYQRYNTSTPETTQILYVKKGTSGGDGTSWAKAYGELSDALAKCEAQGGISQIWVAAGTYSPLYLSGNGTNSYHDKSFVLPKDIKIYGGFIGTETSLTQRNWILNSTTLDGNNNAHVIIYSGPAGSAVLDGFHITGGNHNGDWSRTIIVNGNNINTLYGAGLYLHNSSPNLNNLKIHANYGTDVGGIYCTDNSNPTISNTLIYNNSSSGGCAGIKANNSSPIVINSTITQNNGPNWGVAVISGAIIFKNSIIYGNNNSLIDGSPTFSYCLVQEGTVSGTSIISNANPNLDANHRLTTGSPAIDRGNNTYVSNLTYDLDRHSRIANSTVDLGAYEFNSIINQWVGGTSTNPEVATNWQGGVVPADDEYFEFSASAQRNMALTKDRSIRNVDNSTTRSIDVNGYKLTLKGDVSFAGSGRIIASNSNSTIELAGTAAQTIEDGIFDSNNIGKLIINNTSGVTLKSDKVSCGTLTINSGTSLTIPASKWMSVSGTITNNAGVGGLILKASETLPSATLTFGNSSANPVSATVEMYSKAYKDANGPTGYKYKWQFFGIPVKATTAQTFMGNSYIKEYDETSSTSQGIWKTISGTSAMSSLKGYEITQLAEKTLTFTGVLENSDINKSLSYSTGKTYAGQHIISNPYTSSIAIGSLNFTNAEATVYLYNTGSYSDWNSNSSSTSVSNNPGQYVGAPKITAGSAGIPAVIPPMQGFLVKATGSGASLSYSYSNNQKNSTLQRSRSKTKSEAQDLSYLVINVNGQRYSDKLWLFNSNECSTAFDDGWDAYKLSAGAASSAPMIYTQRGDSLYQIDCVNNIDGTPVSIVAGEESAYTLTFEQQNLSNYFNAVHLVDLFTGISTDLTLPDATYTFTTTNDDSKRFRIVATNDFATSDQQAKKQSLTTYFANGKLFIANTESTGGELLIYNTVGKICKHISYAPNETKSVGINLANGIYILQSKGANYQYKFTVIQ